MSAIITRLISNTIQLSELLYISKSCLMSFILADCVLQECVKQLIPENFQMFERRWRGAYRIFHDDREDLDQMRCWMTRTSWCRSAFCRWVSAPLAETTELPAETWSDETHLASNMCIIFIVGTFLNVIPLLIFMIHVCVSGQNDSVWCPGEAESGRQPHCIWGKFNMHTSHYVTCPRIYNIFSKWNLNRSIFICIYL